MKRPITLLLSIAILSFFSCKTNAKLNPKNVDGSISNASYEGIDFYTLTEHLAQNEACIKASDQVREQLNNLRKLEEINEGQRGYIQKKPIVQSLPERLQYEHYSLEFILCANPKGDIVIAQLMSETIQIHDNEEEVLMESMFENSFTPDSDADCMDCKKYTLHKN